MVWQFSDGGDATWNRVDDGTSGVVGVWLATDVALYAIIHADGQAQLVGETDACLDERARNGDNCYEVTPYGGAIAIDGNLSDWDAVSEDARLPDDPNDFTGTDAGADVAGMSVAYSNNTLYVLMELHSPPSTSFQGGPPPNDGTYRLTVSGTTGLSLSERIYYEPGTGEWTLATSPGSGTNPITAAVGPMGIEWAVDVSAYAGPGFTSVDLILLEPRGCTDTCDQAACGFFSVP
jgi:hypothetical protein